MELTQKIASSQTEAVQEKANAEVAAVSSSISKGILFGKEINGNNVKIIDTKIVGEVVAKRAIAKNISDVVFDRGGYLYIGRIQALADGAREAGLKF